MKIYKITLIVFFLTLFSVHVPHSQAAEKLDCSKFNNDTVISGLKLLMCQKNPEKLDKDGNFKKGAFNIFKFKKKK